MRPRKHLLFSILKSVEQGWKSLPNISKSWDSYFFPPDPFANTPKKQCLLSCSRLNLFLCTGAAETNGTEQNDAGLSLTFGNDPNHPSKTYLLIFVLAFSSIHLCKTWTEVEPS